MPKGRRRFDHPPPDDPGTPPTTAPGEPSAPSATSSAAEAPESAGDAIGRLLRRLEGADLTPRLAAIARERREAPALVDELLSRPQPRSAAADPLLATPEVVWQLLERSREQGEAAAALPLLRLARQIAVHLAALRPEAALPRQLRVEVACETAQRLLDRADPAAAAAALREAPALLCPEDGYARALYCLALARLRRVERRWEEALALGERALRLLADHGSGVERAAAEVELGWTLLDAGDADVALPLFERALEQVETVPFSAISCRLGLAVALRESGDAGERRGRRIDQLLADAEWMIGQTGAARDPAQLRRIAAQAAARCRRAPPSP
jgi:tetratricopeptide (TPR) repeat protein